MSFLKKQPRRLHLNIEDGGRYQQFEKPWPELDFTIHDYISKSEVKTESSSESEVKMHSAHESEVKKQSSHDSTAVEDICNICAAINVNKKTAKKVTFKISPFKDENKRTKRYHSPPPPGVICKRR